MPLFLSRTVGSTWPSWDLGRHRWVKGINKWWPSHNAGGSVTCLVLCCNGVLSLKYWLAGDKRGQFVSCGLYYYFLTSGKVTRSTRPISSDGHASPIGHSLMSCFNFYSFFLFCSYLFYLQSTRHISKVNFNDLKFILLVNSYTILFSIKLNHTCHF